MLKKRLNLRNVVAIATCLAVTTIFSGCDKKEEDKTLEPGAVENLTATTSDAEISVTWNAPANDGGTAITGYELTIDNWANKVTKTASELTHTFVDLINGTEYTVKVRAINAKGTGVESTVTATPMASAMLVSYYSITDDGVKYALFIENPSQMKSTYTPQEGDIYLMAVMQPNESLAVFDGEVTDFKNGSSVEITLEFYERKFTVIIQENLGMTQMTGYVPSNYNEGPNFSLSLGKIDKQWYKYKNDPPVNVPFPLLPKGACGSYAYIFDSTPDKNIASKWNLNGSCARHFSKNYNTGYEWVQDEDKTYAFAWIEFVDEFTYTGAKVWASDEPPYSPVHTTLTVIGVFQEDGSFRHAGFDYRAD